MGNFSRKALYNGAFGFLVGYGTRKSFDNYNRKNMIEKYNETGDIPKRKSLSTAIALAFAFGSFGLLYISPKLAKPMILVDFPLMVVMISILLRPIVVFIAISATISHNAVAREIFGRYREEY